MSSSRTTARDTRRRVWSRASCPARGDRAPCATCGTRTAASAGRRSANRALAESTVIRADGGRRLRAAPRLRASHMRFARPATFVQGAACSSPRPARRARWRGRRRGSRSSPGGSRTGTTRSRCAGCRGSCRRRRTRCAARAAAHGVLARRRVRVNGFNERFEGWGREDSEFHGAAEAAGLWRRKLKFGGSSTTCGTASARAPRSATPTADADRADGRAGARRGSTVRAGERAARACV